MAALLYYTVEHSRMPLVSGVPLCLCVFCVDMAEKHCLDDVMSVGRDMVEYLQQRLMSA